MAIDCPHWFSAELYDKEVSAAKDREVVLRLRISTLEHRLQAINDMTKDMQISQQNHSLGTLLGQQVTAQTAVIPSLKMERTALGSLLGGLF